MKYDLLKKAVLKFDYIFTQDEKSKDLFKSIGHNNVFNSGDTRFDRVSLSKTLNEDVDYISYDFDLALVHIKYFRYFIFEKSGYKR